MARKLDEQHLVSVSKASRRAFLQGITGTGMAACAAGTLLPETAWATANLQYGSGTGVAGLDLRALDVQWQQLSTEVRARRAVIEADRRRDVSRDLRTQKLTEQRDMDILRKVGLKIEALQEQDKAELQVMLSELEDFKKLPPPEPFGLPGKDGLFRQIVAEQAGAHTWLLPPAYACEPGTVGPNVQCSPALAEWNMRDHSSGLGGGWGCWAYGGPLPSWTGLWFLFWPPVSGSLYVYPFVHARGTVYVNAHDHWYTCTDADLRLTLWSNLYQFYWDTWHSVDAIHEHRSDSSASYWVDRYYLWGLENSTTVVAGTPVWIYLEAELYAEGRSDHAVVDADFFSGADQFIRVPFIWTYLQPFR
jgi:hypothetical protein